MRTTYRWCILIILTIVPTTMSVVAGWDGVDENAVRREAHEAKLPSATEGAKPNLATCFETTMRILDDLSVAVASQANPAGLIFKLREVRGQVALARRSILAEMESVGQACVVRGFDPIITARHKSASAGVEESTGKLLHAVDLVLISLTDFDNDGDVDADDIMVFEQCSTGPSAGTVREDCRTADVDADGDVDQDDFGQVQANITGPGDGSATGQSLANAVRIAREQLGLLKFVSEAGPYNARPTLWQPATAESVPVWPGDPNEPGIDLEGGDWVTAPPVADDLNPTIDVQITQEITDKAAELGNAPLALYEFVRNECEFQPYLGSRKGSVETLRQRAGNDYDLASLLIALLRASGTPARYGGGMVEMTPDRTNSWLGVDNASVAGSILTTKGMEGTTIYQGTPDNIVAVRCRRIWVETYIPRGRGSPTWVPLDPSFKLHEIHPGIDIPEEMGLDAQAFVDEYLDPADPSVTLPRSETLLGLLEQQIAAYLAAHYPGETVESVKRLQAIAPEALGEVPASLPYKVRSRDVEYPAIPATRRYQVRFHLHHGGTTLINQTLDLPAVASKRITISYVGATPADQAVIDSYNGLLYTPPYLVQLKPVFTIAGQTVATGGTIGAGVTHSSDIYFVAPAGESNPVPAIYNDIVAGEYQAIGLAAQGVTNPILLPPDPADTEVFDAKFKHTTAMTYLERCSLADESFAALFHSKVSSDVDDAILQDQIAVGLNGWGDPLSWEWRGMTVDADRKIVGVWKVDEYQTGCGGEARDIMLLGGAEGSLYENRVFEDDSSQRAVSTIKILELAVDQGIPVYTRWNSTTLPGGVTLPAYMRNAIISAISGGHVVTFPASQVTHGSWTGIGYIDLDPCSGAAGYIIAGGQNGGSTVDTWTDWIWTNALKKVDYIEGDVEVPPYDSPDSEALFCKLDSRPLHFEYKLRVHYTDGSTGSWRDCIHNSKSPDQLPSADHYYLFVGDQGADRERKLTIFELELEEAMFTGGHVLRTDDGTYSNNGTGVVRVPQIKRGAPSTEICYTWDSSPALNAELKVSPSLGSGSKQLKSKLEATQVGRSVSLTYEKPITVSGSDVVETFTVTNGGQLAHLIDNTTFDIKWQISCNGGASYHDLTTTSNRLFVTAATPNGSTLTVKRASWCAQLAAGSTTAAQIGDKIGPDAVSGTRFGGNSIFGSPPSLSSAWEVMDGKRGDCGTLSTLMKHELEVLGVSGAEVRFVFARHASWSGLSQPAPPYTSYRETDGSGNPLGLWFGGGLGAGWNNYEGCCVFQSKWWEGGMGRSKASAYAVLLDVIGSNSSGASNSHQCWLNDTVTAVPVPPGTP